MATILVTGGAKRIGLAIVRDLAARGHAVVIHHHDSADAADKLTHALIQQGGKAAYVSADLNDRSETQSLIARASQAINAPITGLVNNASIYEKDTLSTVTNESWDRHLEINLHAPFTLTQAFAAQCPSDANGCVINMIDQRVWKLNPQFMSYTLSKAGLWTLTQTMAQALAPHIRVNAIGPGPTLPSIHQKGDSFTHEEKRVLLKKGPTLDEISKAVQFILDTPSMTGQMIALDGGQHLAWQTPDITTNER